MHPMHPPNNFTRPQAQKTSSRTGFKAVALTDGVYVAPASNALTDEPLWVNVSERGTWASS